MKVIKLINGSSFIFFYVSIVLSSDFVKLIL